MAKYFSLKLLRAQQNCHPDRSVPGFPATRHSPASTCAAFSKESRMKFANATNLNRKSGERSGGTCCFFRRTHTLLQAIHQALQNQRGFSVCARNPKKREQQVPRPVGPARQISAQPGRAGTRLRNIPERQRRGTHQQPRMRLSVRKFGQRSGSRVSITRRAVARGLARKCPWWPILAWTGPVPQTPNWPPKW